MKKEGGIMKVLDLFSGIGGFALGLEAAGMNTVAFCEQDTYCQKVLKKHWPKIPIHSDITELNGYEYRGTVDLVCGGFPCQPFSVAGKQLGTEDDRALWPEMLRVIREVAPRWVIGENVSGIIPMELDKVLFDLEGEGYTCWTFVLPACAVDAHHRRDRVWVVAHTDSKSQPVGSQYEQRMVAHSISSSRRQSKRLAQRADKEAKRASNTSHSARSGQNVSNPHRQGLQGGQKIGNAKGIWAGGNEQPERCVNDGWATWLPEPRVGRVADGIPNRSHRLKALGNAVVPPLVAEIGRLVMQKNECFENG